MRKGRVASIIRSVLLLLLSSAWLFPVYIILVNSFKSREEMYLNTLSLPSSLDFRYYAEAMERMDFFRAFRNSLILTVGGVILVVVFCSMAAWMLVRHGGRLSRLIYDVLVITMLIPFQTVMMPLIQEMSFMTRVMGIPMLNTLGGMLFMYLGFGAGMGVFLFYGFIRSSVPTALEESAIIDGCGVWTLFWRIVFPLLKSITITVAILEMIKIWNDYLLPSLSLTSIDNSTIPLAMSLFIGQYTVEWNMAMAGLMMSIIPVIIFYLYAQKHIVKGVAAGAVKG